MDYSNLHGPYRLLRIPQFIMIMRHLDKCNKAPQQAKAVSITLSIDVQSVTNILATLWDFGYVERKIIDRHASSQRGPRKVYGYYSTINFTEWLLTLIDDSLRPGDG